MRHVLATLLLVTTACGSSSPPAPKPQPPADAPANGTAQAVTSSEEEQMAAIERAIGERGPGVYQCRSLAAADDLRVNGQIGLSLTLGPDSRVSGVAVVEDTVGDSVLTECLQKLWANAMFDATFAAGDTVALPPFVFVAEGVQYTVEASHVSPHKTGGVAIATVLSPKNTGNATADLEVVHIDDGAGLGRLAPVRGGAPLPVELLFVVKGAGTVKGPGVTSRYQEGSALYAPVGLAYELVDDGDSNETVLVRFRVHDSVAGKARKLYFRTAGAAETLSIAGGKATIHLYFDKGVVGESSAYLGSFEAQPGLAIPEHVHEGSSEYLLIVAGEGRMTVEDKSFPVAAGDAIQVPPNTRHSFVAMGTTPVGALQFYSPSGPEQRFRK